MAITLLITAKEIIDTAFTNKNVLEMLIKDTLIRATQEQYIRPVLNDLYPILLAGSLTTDNQELVDDFVKPCLAYYVKAENLPDMSFNTTSKGPVTIDDEFTSPITDRQRSILIKKTLDIANALRDEMVRFLEDDDNIDKYPDYLPSANIGKKVSNFGGIVLDPPNPPITTPENRR